MKGFTAKSWITLVGVLLAGILIYYAFSGNIAISEDSLLMAQPEGEAASAEVLNLLNQIQSLHIDASLFQSPAYQSLVDYTVPIPDQNVGRPNPFAPIPGVRDSESAKAAIR